MDVANIHLTDMSSKAGERAGGSGVASERRGSRMGRTVTAALRRRRHKEWPRNLLQYRREQRCSHLNRYGDCRYLYIDPHGMVIHDDPEKAEDLQQYKSGTRGAMKQGRDENHNVEGIKHSKN